MFWDRLLRINHFTRSNIFKVHFNIILPSNSMYLKVPIFRFLRIHFPTPTRTVPVQNAYRDILHLQIEKRKHAIFLDFESRPTVS